LAPYHAPEELSKEQVKEWLRMAMSSKFNIFSDTNKVIALLCYELLRKMENER
tara:strand:- start:1861 stop:2019 length:159 start_codon:yes stop_codon:yes gene_type:complete